MQLTSQCISGIIAKLHYTGPTGPVRTFLRPGSPRNSVGSVRVSDSPCGSGRARVVEFSLNYRGRGRGSSGSRPQQIAEPANGLLAGMLRTVEGCGVILISRDWILPLVPVFGEMRKLPQISPEI